MNSKLFTKKTAFAFVGMLTGLLIICVLVNIFLIRPAVAGREYVTHIEAVTEPEVDPFSDADKTDDGLVYYIRTADGGTTYVDIVSYRGENPNVVIPSEIEGYPVTVIHETCFAYKEIESVKIPNSVTFIDGWAFAGCKNLKEVHIPESVNEMGPFITLESKKAVVYAPANSYAQQYCKENKIPFQAE